MTDGVLRPGVHVGALPPWGPCPNQVCEHPVVLHDLDTLDEPFPVCCVDGCGCRVERIAQLSV